MYIAETTLVVIILFTALSIVWSTLVSGISPMPSSMRARQAMLHLFRDIEPNLNTEAGPVFELGSGWGNVLIPLAKQYPQRRFVGYELSVIPWLTNVVVKKLLRLNNITVYRKNFLHADLSSASVIVCYLHSKGMQQIKNKTDEKDSQIKYLISNNFALPTSNPLKTLQLNDLYKSPVYLYQFHASV